MTLRLVLSAVGVWVTGFVLSTALALRMFVEHQEYCHRDHDLVKRGCQHPGYSGAMHEDCWSLSKTGEVELWMLKYTAPWAVAWPLVAWPMLAYYLARRRPTTRSERAKLERLEREYEELRAKQQRHDDIDEELEKATPAELPILARAAASPTVQRLYSRVRMTR
jgi:hypothetical protein